MSNDVQLNGSVNTTNLKVNRCLSLNIYPKVISILANNNVEPSSNTFFINKQDNKLYQYNLTGTDFVLVNGNYLIGYSDNSYYNNRAWTVNNGEMKLLETYFDDSNLKLFIDSQEIMENGSLIITDDYKLYIRINNVWISH